MFWRVLHDFLKWLWPALFALMIAIITVVLAAAQIWPPVKDWVATNFSMGLSVVGDPWFLPALVAAFVAWLGIFVWSAHKVAKPNTSEAEKVITLLTGELQRLLPPQQVVNAVPDNVRHIADWSDAKLKTEVAQLADDLRVYEAESNPLRTLYRSMRRGGTEEEMHAQWQAETHALLAASAQRQQGFQRRFQSKLVAYRDELRQRLHEEPPFSTNHRAVAIDHGMLAGPSPLADAANVIEEMARRLPDHPER